MLLWVRDPIDNSILFVNAEQITLTKINKSICSVAFTVKQFSKTCEKRYVQDKFCVQKLIFRKARASMPVSLFVAAMWTRIALRFIELALNMTRPHRKQNSKLKLHVLASFLVYQMDAFLSRKCSKQSMKMTTTDWTLVSSS